MHPIVYLRLPQLARASGGCTLHILPERPAPGSRLPCELMLIMPFESVALHPGHTQRSAHWEAQTGINSGCKARVSSVLAFVPCIFFSCLSPYKAEACNDALFFFFFHSWNILLSALGHFYNGFTHGMPYATELTKLLNHLFTS